MKSNTYAISDIHGCYKQLCDLLNKLDLKSTDTLIFMGDYVDRGPNSKQVLNKIIELKNYYNVIALKGNHEDMMYRSLREESAKDYRMWMNNGGLDTIRSYYDLLESFPSVLDSEMESHLDFIDSLDLYYETDTHIFVHASPSMDTPISEQSESYLIWRRPQDNDSDFNYTHISGKTIISGHTAQSTGYPYKLSDKNYLIDTGCFFTSVLTAYHVESNSFINNL